MILITAQEAWDSFCKKIVDFFWVEDSYGVNYLTRIIVAIVVIVIGWILIKLLMMLLKKLMGITKRGPEIDASAKFFIVEMLKVLLWFGVALLVVTILKINITGLAGVVSAITVALGLALQDVISCLASGILILQQKHFVTGDYIKVNNGFGECEGTVSKIRFFFTFLRTIDGQEVTIPNNNVLKAVVTNYTKIGKRRLNYDVGVSYDTDIELCKKVLTEILENEPTVLKDGTITVFVTKLDSFAVQVRMRCWLKNEDYWPFYYSLSEKVLIACRKNNIYIPSSTDINISNRK